MERKSPRQLYYKLFFSYSAVILLIVGSLLVYSISASRSKALETSQDYAGKLCSEAVLAVSRASADADNLHKALYQSSMELNDILNYFRHDTEGYLKEHLDVYTESNTLESKDIFSYTENIFDLYTDIEKVEYISYVNNKCTTFYSMEDVRVENNGQERRRQLNNGGLAQNGRYSFQKEIRDPQTLKTEGCIIYTYSVKKLQEIQKSYPAAKLYLFYTNGARIYPDKAGTTLEQFRKWETEKKRSLFLQIQNVDTYTLVTSLDKNKAASIPVSGLLAIFGIAAVLVLMGECFISGYLKRLEKRLSSILEGMEQVQTGNLKIRLQTEEEGDELDMISAHFNGMCQELDSYIQKSYLAEIEQKNAEMQALQSQINPHFLYNTLEAIRMKAICNGDREVGKMLYSMAVTFRSQLKEADVITLMQEMHYCKKYLELFEYRYQEKFVSEVQCDPALGEIPIIKFVLQPVIENYFIHGIKMEEEHNKIMIWAEREQKDLLLHVEDNGYGMEEAAMELKNIELRNNEMDSHKSIGFTNVNRRLKAVYGNDCGVTLKKRDGGGMHVILRVRIKESSGYEESDAG